MANSRGITRALVRLAGARRSNPDAGGDTRSRILAEISSASEPLSIEQLSALTSAHPNTVRGHLEVLVASGAVQRRVGDSAGRGRRPWLYLPAVDRGQVADELVASLNRTLGEDPDPALIMEAAQRWSGGSPLRGEMVDTDQALEEVAERLTEMGFAAEVGGIGDSLVLRACPYADLVRDQPVICRIHSALLTDLLERTGHEVELQTMEVFPRPGACVARLNRPDIDPEWTVKPEPPAPAPESAPRKDQ